MGKVTRFSFYAGVVTVNASIEDRVVIDIILALVQETDPYCVVSMFLKPSAPLLLRINDDRA